MKTIRLREGKERSALRSHPWIFDSAIAKGGADSGETVRVESHSGSFLGWAAFSPSSKIRARIWSFDETQRIDAAFFEASIKRAIAARSRFDIQSNGMRLIHGESDGLPGLIVDRYDDTLVAQFLSSGTERWKQEIANALLAQTGLSKLYERSDSGVRGLEGLQPATGWLRGEGSTGIELREHDWKLSLDIAEGHKTGFYLDQRDSRKKFADYTNRLQFQRVLNCYCYTGGFTVAALAGGAAHVTSIDSSGPAIERAKSNVALNGFDAARTTMMDADVNASLRQFYKDGQTFDAIVLDPPKFAPIGRARRSGGTRLQRHQPIGFQNFGARWRVVHLQLFGWHWRRVIPQNSGLRGHRCGRRWLYQRAYARRARPSHDLDLPRGRISEGFGGHEICRLGRQGRTRDNRRLTSFISTR